MHPPPLHTKEVKVKVNKDIFEVSKNYQEELGYNANHTPSIM